MRTRKGKKRKAAEALYDQARIHHDNKEPLEAYKFAKLAVKKQANLVNHTYHYWRRLGSYQYYLAHIRGDAKDEKDDNKHKWYQRAIASIKNIPEGRRSNDDKRFLAQCYSGMDLDKKALLELKKIPKQEFTYDDYGKKASYYYYRYLKTNDPKEILKYLTKAIEANEQIPRDERSLDNWKNVAEQQVLVGKLYREKREWETAWRYFQTALTADAISLGNIKSCFINLKIMCRESTIQYGIYEIGKDLFNDNNYNIRDLKNAFYRVYLEVKQTKDPTILSQFIHIMRLVNQYFDKPSFQNKQVAALLRKPGALKAFQQMRSDLEAICHPRPLADLLNNGHSTTVAMTLKIKSLETEVAFLKTELEKLKQASIFNTSSTLFQAGPSTAKISQSTYKKKRPR